MVAVLGSRHLVLRIGFSEDITCSFKGTICFCFIIVSAINRVPQQVLIVLLSLKCFRVFISAFYEHISIFLFSSSEQILMKLLF